MFPVCLRIVCQAEKLVQVGIRNRLGIQPRAGDTTQLDLGLCDHTGQPQAANGGSKPIRAFVRPTMNDFAIGANKGNALDMIPKRP